MDTIKTRLVIQVPNLMKVDADLNEKTINLILEKMTTEFEFTTESQDEKVIININDYSTINNWLWYLTDELIAKQGRPLPYDDFIYEFVDKVVNYLENDKIRKKDDSVKEYFEDKEAIKFIKSYLIDTHNILSKKEHR